jgi:hypothetical protein
MKTAVVCDTHHRKALKKLTYVSEALTASIIRAMGLCKAVSFYHNTRRNIPEDSHLH